MKPQSTVRNPFTLALTSVVLAAGDGSRLEPLTRRLAKPLVPVGGRPLITYTLEALVANGITDLILVVGYRADQIMQTLGDGSALGARLTYVTSAHTGRSNGLSLYAAREVIQEQPFLLTMADHMVSPRIIRRLLAAMPTTDTLCVDRSPPAYLVDEATRVWVDHAGWVRAIGKHIPRWNAVDTGVFCLTEAIFQAVEAVQEAGERRPRLIDAARWLVKNGDGLRVCDVTGAFWLDVDTPADLSQAERLLRQRSRLQ